MSWPSMDHGILSPSGRASERSRNLALKRVAAELFPEGLARPTCEQSSEKESLLRHAALLRDLAARGMKPRAYAKEAARLEALAAELAE